jgi:hypothetical protein
MIMQTAHFSWICEIANVTAEQVRGAREKAPFKAFTIYSIQPAAI